MKIIFLEMFGTLMLPVCEMTAILHNEPVKGFKPAVDALNFIVSQTKAQIVITSDCRANGKQWCQTKLEEWGVKATVRDTTPIGDKSTAISRYLIWATIPESYVIIDCCDIENTGYAALSEHLVKTDPEFKGLTMELAQQAVEILNRGKQSC